ncbi:MAG: hypothetical protein WKG07_48180 [Hymenobacter sp.]
MPPGAPRRARPTNYSPHPGVGAGPGRAAAPALTFARTRGPSGPCLFLAFDRLFSLVYSALPGRWARATPPCCTSARAPWSRAINYALAALRFAVVSFLCFLLLSPFIKTTTTRTESSHRGAGRG